MAKQSRRNILLWEARVRHCLTQSQLAEIADVTPKTVQRWESGKSTPRAYSLQKLCMYFNDTPAGLGFHNPREEEGDEQANDPGPGSSQHSTFSIHLILLIVGGILMLGVIAAVLRLLQ